MIELRAFVTSCLEQIIGAVSDAQANVIGKERGAVVNPYMGTHGKKMAEGTISGGDWIAQMVDFDIAVTAQEGAGSKATVGVFAGAFGAGTQGTLTHETTTVSRIKFSVPVVLPRTEP